MSARGIRKATYLSPGTVAYIEARTREGDGETWSAHVNGAISVVSETLRRNMPTLTVAAWQAVLDAYAGHAPTPGIMDVRVASSVMDHHDIVDLSVADPGIAAVVRELAALTPEQAMAVYDLAVRFWCRAWGEGDLADWVRELGGKVR